MSQDHEQAAIPEENMAQILTIKKAAATEAKALRTRYPLLNKYQSAVGLAILLGSLGGMIGTGALYLTDILPFWVAIPVIAFFCSIAHEIEHDTIHRCYFPRNEAMQHVFFAIVWLMRPNTVSPWKRKHLHLLHHKVSGTRGDIEERSVTNGEEWNLKRLFMLGDGFLAVLLRLPFHRPHHILPTLKLAASAYSPLGFVHHGLWWTFLGFNAVVGAAALLGIDLAPSGVLADAAVVLTSLIVVWIAPNILRSFCLNFVTSNMHYFGDIETGNVVKQTQVINSLWFLPFHLFCFNFATTHAIHHFWVVEPFYLRQMSAKKVLPVMKENGVRFNDLDNMKRANRWGDALRAA